MSPRQGARLGQTCLQRSRHRSTILRSLMESREDQVILPTLPPSREDVFPKLSGSHPVLPIHVSGQVARVGETGEPRHVGDV